jgi:hypothetical protein
MRRQRTLAVLLGGLLALGQLAGATAIGAQPGNLKATPLTPSERVSGAKSVSGKLAQTDKELLARNDRQMVNVVIKLDYDAIAAYTGGGPASRSARSRRTFVATRPTSPARRGRPSALSSGRSRTRGSG